MNTNNSGFATINGSQRRGWQVRVLDDEDYREQRAQLIEERDAAEAVVQRARDHVARLGGAAAIRRREAVLRRMADLRATILAGVGALQTSTPCGGSFTSYSIACSPSSQNIRGCRRRASARFAQRCRASTWPPCSPKASWSAGSEKRRTSQRAGTSAGWTTALTASTSSIG